MTCPKKVVASAYSLHLLIFWKHYIILLYVIACYLFFYFTIISNSVFIKQYFLHERPITCVITYFTQKYIIVNYYKQLNDIVN